VDDIPNAADSQLLNRIGKCLPILADLSRSDLLLYLPAEDGAIVAQQGRPHSIFPMYAEDLVGSRSSPQAAPWVLAALGGVRPQRGAHRGTVKNAPIVREVLPVLGQGGRAIAALSIETNLLAYERHRRRAKAFRRALQQLQEMVLRGELTGTEELSPFGEHDGILLVNAQHMVQYTSGIAANLFRRIGHMDNLVRRSVYSMETADAEVVDEALSRGVCVEREKEEHGRIFIRKALPIYVHRAWWSPLSGRGSDPEIPAPPGAVPVGILVTLHDATSARDKERELRAKMVMIQEVHHRVKNNLQSIASLLRMQARRTTSSEVETALLDTVNRILSVAVVHEFLSYDTGGVINLLEIAQRIAGQMSQSVLDPSKSIQLQVSGPGIYLSSQQATACALVINELLENALQHGFESRSQGKISIELTDDGEWVGIHIGDDGAGLPGEFNLSAGSGLGLRIVQSLVEGDLKGRFEMRSDRGARAIVTFPKTLLGGAGR
jgi:two-component sensor histidine kinase